MLLKIHFMPRFKTHAVIGTGAGIAYSLAVQNRREKCGETLSPSLQIVHMASCAVAAYIGGCCPDILEPASRATGPNHRGAFHSITAGSAAIKGMVALGSNNESDPSSRWLFDILGAFYAGYLSHLAADFLTPRSLNIACKGF